MLRVFGEMLGRLRERLAPAGVEVGDLVIARDLVSCVSCIKVHLKIGTCLLFANANCGSA